MPVAPDKVFEQIRDNTIAFVLSKQARDNIAQVMSFIDDRLNNQDYLISHISESLINPKFNFVVAKELTSYEKSAIKDLYLLAGWGAVNIKNSSENGERPGLCTITLYKNALKG